MKWFQHQSDSNSNLKLLKLQKIFGIEGYGFYWLVAELVAQQGINYTISKDKDWQDWLNLRSNLPIEKINALLEKMAEFDLINKKEFEKGNLSIPQMAEYSDDYTNRVRRVSEQGSHSVRKDKIRIDKNIYMPILQEFAKQKGIEKLTSSFFVRNTEVAKRLSEYPLDKIKEVMVWLGKHADFKWTLESVEKYIDEDLSKIKGKFIKQDEWRD